MPQLLELIAILLLIYAGPAFLALLVVRLLVVFWLSPKGLVNRKVTVLVAMVCILAVIGALYALFGGMKRDRESEVAAYAGSTDELGRILDREAEEFRLMGLKQQYGLLAVGGLVTMVAGVWWIRQPKPKAQAPVAESPSEPV